MPRRRDDWFERIKVVEREHTVARLAIDRFTDAAIRNRRLLPSSLKFADVRTASAQLDGTYIIRLFAEFESGLRSYWPTVRGTDPPSRTRDLLDGLAATRRIRRQVVSRAHEVREYRNHVVHERDEATHAIAIAEVRRRLCAFFSFLPPNW